MRQPPSRCRLEGRSHCYARCMQPAASCMPLALFSTPAAVSSRAASASRQAPCVVALHAQHLSAIHTHPRWIHSRAAFRDAPRGPVRYASSCRAIHDGPQDVEVRGCVRAVDSKSVRPTCPTDSWRTRRSVAVRELAARRQKSRECSSRSRSSGKQICPPVRPSLLPAPLLASPTVRPTTRQRSQTAGPQRRLWAGNRLSSTLAFLRRHAGPAHQ